MATCKPIKGYEGKYLVTDEGEVISLTRMIESPRGNYQRNGCTLKAATGKDGYKFVVLVSNGIMKTIKVHRLVAEAFLDNPLGLPEVNHKDENKSNNHAENLEWCSHQYNIEYSKNKPVEQYDLDGTRIAIYKSATYAEKITGIGRKAIYNVLHGRANTAGGYYWKYPKRSNGLWHSPEQCSKA